MSITNPNTKSAERSALEALNYATPLLILLCCVGTAIFFISTLRYESQQPLSRWKLRCLRVLCFLTTVTYTAQALQYLPNLPSAADDGLIHSISQTMLWTTISIITIGTSSPIPVVWITASAINLIAEIIICTLTFVIARQVRPSERYILGTIQICNLLVLATLTIFATYCSMECRLLDHGEETRPLLVGDSTTYSGASQGHHLLDDNISSNSDYSSDEYFDPALDPDAEDDEKEVRNDQKQRLRNSGGWIGYLRSFKIFLPYLVPRKNLRLQLYLLWLIFNTILVRVALVMHPRQLGIIIDKLATERVMPWKDIFLWIIFRAMTTLCGVEAVNDMLENRLAAWSEQQLTVAALDHVMGLSMTFHDEKDSGEIIKAIEQASSLNYLLRRLLLRVIPAAADVVIAMIYLTYLFDAYFLLIFVAVAISYILATYYMTLVGIVKRRLSSLKKRDQSQLIYESVSNWFTIICFNRKSYVMARLSKAVGLATTTDLAGEDVFVYLNAVQEGSAELGRLLLALLAAHRVLEGVATVGMFITLNSYWDSIEFPLFTITRSYREINQHLVDAERLMQLFQVRPSVTDRSDARPLATADGAVVFDHVNFAYSGRESTLNDLNLVTQPGQTIAFVGETGGGKSTILKLLMRFYDVSSGKITVGGQDIRDSTLNSLRTSFGFVPQDTFLFNVSIMENVRYGRLEATDEEVFAACKAASIHDTILGFPKGYTSKVGERGIKLSGGERQRIAIARVFLKDPQIVLLDEATSAMDSQTEGKIQEALRRLTHGRTTFVIAHRLSTIVEADQILVIDHGRVLESGSHEQLLKRKGKYFDLWFKQAALTTT